MAGRLLSRIRWLVFCPFSTRGIIIKVNSSAEESPLKFQVSDEDEGKRLDVFLAARLPQYSRTILRNAIVAGTVTVDGVRTKVAYRLVSGQLVEVVVPKMPRESPVPEDIPLDLLYEDEQVVAVNKPPNMVVHPAKGHWSGTLASALAFHFQQLSTIGGPTRPGIIHRLDRDTSGVILVAKTDHAHQHLAKQFETRTIHKQYMAICRGVPDRDHDRIDQPIGMHPHQREKMAIRANHSTSREAITEFEVHRRYRGFCWLNLYPKTGRTHQIRVHLTHVGCPIVSDRLYAGHARITVGELTGERDDPSIVLERQALHAKMIKFDHPITGQSLVVEAPVPDDLAGVIDLLDRHRSLP